ncbi:ROK family transcriptional regulator [Bacillota bacterium Meth-B3]|nr:ROK family transcriptional regulator [Christensenellaceae bacterium]
MSFMHRQSVSNNVVKQINMESVFFFIQSSAQASAKDIAQGLNMSPPTVTQNIRALIERDLIVGNGTVGSTGGRKARSYAINARACFAAGLDITRRSVSTVILNLKGDVVYHIKHALPFESRGAYYQALGDVLEEALDEAGVAREYLAGVGLSIPAIVVGEGSATTNNALGAGTVCLNDFAAHIPYPCRLINDASAGGYAEFWAVAPRREIDTRHLAYLSVSDTVGGSIMIEGRMYNGLDQHSAEFGHMTLQPEGRPCYCGQKGCAYGYINTRLLSEAVGGELQDFFDALERGEDEAEATWDRYLYHLALAIGNIRAAFDCELIIGGYLGEHIGAYLPELRARAARRNGFEGSGDYVRAPMHKREASAVGAALTFIHEGTRKLLSQGADTDARLA